MWLGRGPCLPALRAPSRGTGQRGGSSSLMGCSRPQGLLARGSLTSPPCGPFHGPRMAGSFSQDKRSGDRVPKSAAAAPDLGSLSEGVRARGQTHNHA